jgi:hypothetical protein
VEHLKLISLQCLSPVLHIRKTYLSFLVYPAASAFLVCEHGQSFTLYQSFHLQSPFLFVCPFFACIIYTIHHMVSHIQALHKTFTTPQVINWAVVCGKNFTSTLYPFLNHSRNVVDNYKINDWMKEFYLVVLWEWFSNITLPVTQNCNHFGIVTHIVLVPT